MLQPAVLQGLAATHSVRASWLWCLLIAMPGSGWHLNPAAMQGRDAGGARLRHRPAPGAVSRGHCVGVQDDSRGWVPGREGGLSRGEAAAHDHRGREGRGLHACRGAAAAHLGQRVSSAAGLRSQLCWTLLESVHSFSAACRAVAVGGHIHSWAGCAR
jgi:hypothetical protein